MAEFTMPSLGADMEAGTLVKWCVSEGDHVLRGEIVAEVETDKGTIEVEAFHTGTVRQLLQEEGAKVPVGTPLAIIDEGAAPATDATSAPAEPSAPEAPTRRARPAAPAMPRQRPQPSSDEDRVRISPLARAQAKQLGVDIAALEGTGPGGAIQASDVVRAAKSGSALSGEPTTAASAPTAGAPTPAAPAPTAAAQDENAMQRAIAAAMTRANDDIPHYYVAQTIDMSAAVAFVKEHNARTDVHERLVPGILLMRAVALAMKRHPEFNAMWRDGRAHRLDDLSVGVAISIRGGGLTAPALRRADEGSLSELMQRLTDLVDRARRGSLRSSEMTGAGITITSLGERGVETVIPIIFPPQVAIVGFGAIAERPWSVDGKVLSRPVIHATLGADHRVTNGHAGSRFLSRIDRLLQKPESL
jgi:pyruvate dehydrogenase E2 component (dihydrolipoamide acetyltransferase)